MATARQIITTALSLHLNRLSPGEAIDPDLSTMCLDALNDIADEWSGSGTFLWKESLVASAALTGITGTLGTDWAAIEPGQELLGATYNAGSGDFPIDPLTMQQYHEQVRIKSLSGGLPRYWAYDGASTVYFYPALTGVPITLRVKQSMSDFADLDTNYVMPNGFKSGLSAVLAERVALPVVGSVPPDVRRAASAARETLAAQVAEPAIIGAGTVSGNILTGWR